MKSKHLMSLVAAVAALTLAFALSACGGSPASSESAGSSAPAEDTSADISTLVVGFDQSYPPYGYVGDDGEFTGFDLDLAAEVAERNGWEVQYEPIDWDAKDTGRSGEPCRHVCLARPDRRVQHGLHAARVRRGRRGCL